MRIFVKIRNDFNRLYTGPWGKLICEENKKLKILCQTPFNIAQTCSSYIPLVDYNRYSLWLLHGIAWPSMPSPCSIMSSSVTQKMPVPSDSLCLCQAEACLYFDPTIPNLSQACPKSYHAICQLCLKHAFS